jgi:hypothetical protein
MEGPGIPGEVIGLMVLFGLIGLGVTVVKVAMARDMARRSGLDADDATAATLLSENGFEAAYLASSLRRPAGNHEASDNGHVVADGSDRRPARSVEDRLRELQRLHDSGTVTDAEYAERRAAILSEI